MIIKKNFKNRKVYINKSFNLIKDAKIVFTHKSTAVSFALCMQKKIIFLTSDDLNKTWYGDQIKYQADLLGSSLLNINSKEDIKDKLKIKINKPKYKRYIQRYIKYPGTKNIYNWNLFLQKLS